MELNHSLLVRIHDLKVEEHDDSKTHEVDDEHYVNRKDSHFFKRFKFAIWVIRVNELFFNFRNTIQLNYVFGAEDSL